MSLEQALAENTAAINNLIAVMSKIPYKHTEPQTSGEASAASVPGEAKIVKTAESPAKDEAPAPPEFVPVPAKAYTYAEVAKRVTDVVSKKGRDAAKQILVRFGASKLPEVDPKDYAELMDACDSVENAK